MNMDQVLSAVRWVITSGGGYAVGRGWITADQVTLIAGIGAAVVPLVWSFFVHKKAA